jgi:hypothetical protein
VTIKSIFDELWPALLIPPLRARLFKISFIEIVSELEEKFLEHEFVLRAIEVRSAFALRAKVTVVCLCCCPRVMIIVSVLSDRRSDLMYAPVPFISDEILLMRDIFIYYTALCLV